MKRCETCQTPIIKCRGNGHQNRRPRDESLVRKCEHCGKVCPRRAKEHDAAYLAKRFCSHTCARTAANQQRWNERHRGRSAARATIPAPTVEEWLRLNGGPTVCPVMYAAPIEHYTHVSSRSGRR